MGPEQAESGGQGNPSGRERFLKQATEIPYASLRVEPNMTVEMDLATLAKLLELAVSYYQDDRQIKSLETAQRLRHQELQKLAETFAGLRGIIDGKNKVILTLSPRETDVEYNENLLKTGLRHFFDDVVSKYFRLRVPGRVTTPRGKIVTAEQMMSTIRQALAKALLVPEEEVAAILNVEPRLDVAEEKLKELQEKGRISLPEGARTVGRIVWTVTTRELKE